MCKFNDLLILVCNLDGWIPDRRCFTIGGRVHTDTEEEEEEEDTHSHWDLLATAAAAAAVPPSTLLASRTANGEESPSLPSDARLLSCRQNMVTGTMWVGKSPLLEEINKKRHVHREGCYLVK